MADIGAEFLIVGLVLLALVRAFKPCWLGDHRWCWTKVYTKSNEEFVACTLCGIWLKIGENFPEWHNG